MITTLALSVSLLTAFACDEAVPLAKDAQSPCEGILVPAADALEAVHCARVALPKCRVAFDSLNEELVIKLDAASQEHDILLDRISKQDSLIADLTASAPVPHWYESRLLWAGGGLVVGVGLTIAILKATLAAH